MLINSHVVAAQNPIKLDISAVTVARVRLVVDLEELAWNRPRANIPIHELLRPLRHVIRADRYRVVQYAYK